MNPEDRVVVGVVNRKRDLKSIQQDHWYRIPQDRMKDGIHAEYLGFYLSKRIFKDGYSNIRYYARITGVELTYRRDLLPDEANHKRANKVYYRISLGKIQEKRPPILNPTKRPITFIHTTWDRFIHAQVISDLYYDSDYYVDRTYHVFRTHDTESEQYVIPSAPGLTILCENGTVNISTQQRKGSFFLDNESEDKIFKGICDRISQQDEPITINIPID